MIYALWHTVQNSMGIWLHISQVFTIRQPIIANAKLDVMDNVGMCSYLTFWHVYQTFVIKFQPPCDKQIVVIIASLYFWQAILPQWAVGGLSYLSVFDAGSVFTSNVMKMHKITCWPYEILILILRIRTGLSLSSQLLNAVALYKKVVVLYNQHDRKFHVI